MAINTTYGGIQKPLEKQKGILYWCDAGDLDVSTITATTDLSTVTDLKEAGAITTDGVTSAANSEDPEVYLDWNGNTFDSSEATSKPSISFSLLEVLNENAALLVFSEAAVTASGGKVTEITGSGNPSNKTLVLKTRIKNTAITVIMPEVSFASRGDDVYANDELYSWSVVYNLLVGSAGYDVKRLFADIV